MNCRGLEKWVWQEGAGNLPAGAVEHAAACPDCRMLIEQVRLLDRSVGASVTPDPDAVYWDALAQRIALRLDQPPDRVVELVPALPAWRRLVARTWAPAMAVALLAVIASQKTTTAPSIDSFNLARVPERMAKLSSPGSSSTGESDQSIAATNRARSDSETRRGFGSKQDVVSAPSLAARSIQEKSEAGRTAYMLPETPQSKMASTEPTNTQLKPATSGDLDKVWPDRQVIIMGQVDSNSPNPPLDDDGRLAGQDPFGAYERQMADAEQGVESAGTFASPGRLLDGPTATASRGSERLTPAEQMRRFDEMAELHELIGRLESVPESSRAMSQWTQWSTAWYRLGMLSHQTTVLDSAITAVGYFQALVPMDSASQAEWLVRKTHLQNRRENLEY